MCHAATTDFCDLAADTRQQRIGVRFTVAHVPGVEGASHPLVEIDRAGVEQDCPTLLCRRSYHRGGDHDLTVTGVCRALRSASSIGFTPEGCNGAAASWSRKRAMMSLVEMPWL